MTWQTTSEIGVLADRALAFLESDPVAHTALLTEAAHLLRHPEPRAEQCYGWWTDVSGAVTGAFVQAPRHWPLLSLVPNEAATALPSALPAMSRVGVDERYVACVRDGWPGTTEVLARISVHRLGRAVALPSPEGSARLATAADRDLLVGWFDRFKAAQPDDPSDQEFVIDDPLDDGAIVLWEVGGQPVAMSSRTPSVAGMTRIGLVFSPSGDPLLECAALAAGCARALEAADAVLAFSPGDGTRESIRLRDLGFVTVGSRVLLSYRAEDSAS